MPRDKYPFKPPCLSKTEFLALEQIINNQLFEAEEDYERCKVTKGCSLKNHIYPDLAELEKVVHRMEWWFTQKTPP